MSRLKAHRDALKVREGYWFARKLYGFGATPVTWQGWAVTGVFGAIFGAIFVWAPTIALKIGMTAPLLIAFLYFVWSKTDGGWGWRWGPDKR